MTHHVTTSKTEDLLFDLVDLVASGRDADRAETLATIIARRENLSLATVYAMASAEFAA
jgi:hypothetical protein